MAQGTVTVFDEAKLALLNGTHDLDTHTFKVMLINDTTVPTAATATPVKADFTEVSGSNYTAGGESLTVSLTEAAGTVTFDFTNDITWTQHASGPTDIEYAIVYNDTAASDDAIAFIDMTTDAGVTPLSLADGDIKITWNANGLFQLS